MRFVFALILLSQALPCRAVHLAVPLTVCTIVQVDDALIISRLRKYNDQVVENLPVVTLSPATEKNWGRAGKLCDAYRNRRAWSLETYPFGPKKAKDGAQR